MLFPVLLPEPPSRLPGTRFAQSQIGVACGIRRVRSSLARRVFWLWRARTRGSLPGPCSPLPRLVRSERPWDRTARAYLGGFPPPSPPLDLPCPAGSTLWCPRFGSVATPSCSSSLLRHSVFSVRYSVFARPSRRADPRSQGGRANCTVGQLCTSPRAGPAYRDGAVAIPPSDAGLSQSSAPHTRVNLTIPEGNSVRASRVIAVQGVEWPRPEGSCCRSWPPLCWLLEKGTGLLHSVVRSRRSGEAAGPRWTQTAGSFENERELKRQERQGAHTRANRP